MTPLCPCGTVSDIAWESHCLSVTFDADSDTGAGLYVQGSAGLWDLSLEARVAWALAAVVPGSPAHTSKKITTQRSHLPYSHEDAWLFSSASRSALKVCASWDACASVHPGLLPFSAQ